MGMSWRSTTARRLARRASTGNRVHRHQRGVRQAFVKDDSVGRLLRLGYRPRTGPMRKLRIRLEVDANPSLGASYDMPVLDYPFPAAVRIFDLPSLFAG